MTRDERNKQQRNSSKHATHSEQVEQNETEWEASEKSTLQSIQAQSIGPNPANREQIIEETSGSRRGRGSR